MYGRQEGKLTNWGCGASQVGPAEQLGYSRSSLIARRVGDWLRLRLVVTTFLVFFTMWR
jgi:hypothetical protein